MAVTTKFFPDGTPINLPGAFYVGGSMTYKTWYDPRREYTYKVMRAKDRSGRLGWHVTTYPFNACGNCWERVKHRYGF